MDENSRKSRDSDALGSVSTKRLSLTRTTRETRELICVIYIKRILFMNNDTNSSFVEFILNTYLHYTMIHRSNSTFIFQVSVKRASETQKNRTESVN